MKNSIIKLKNNYKSELISSLLIGNVELSAELSTTGPFNLAVWTAAFICTGINSCSISGASANSSSVNVKNVVGTCSLSINVEGLRKSLKNSCLHAWYHKKDNNNKRNMNK